MNRGLRPPRAALQAWLRAIYSTAGKYETLGRVAMRATGREYKTPDRTAEAWVRGESFPPGDVIFALQQIFPEIRLTDYALAPATGEPGSASMAAELAARIEGKLDRVDEVVNAIVAWAITVGDRVGVDFLALAQAPPEGTLDPRAAAFLARLRGEEREDDPADAEETP